MYTLSSHDSIYHLLYHFITAVDENSLQELCYITSDIDRLTVCPDGGTFTLGNGDASLEIPPGAVEHKMSIHYAIILHGPFVFPTGYKLASVVIYLNLDEATLVKPVQLTLSHWCSREEEYNKDALKFLTAPHTLQEGKMYYVFEEQKQVDFTTCFSAGVLSIEKPHCVHCIVMQEEEMARYNAISFHKYIAPQRTLYFKVQFMCNSKEWNEVSIRITA